MPHYKRKNKHSRAKSEKRNFEEDDEELNRSVYKKWRRFKLTSCSYCPPHGGENARRQERPTKYKDRRKGKI